MASTKNSPLNPLNIAGVDYYVEWDDFRVGHSFFLPCLATPRTVKTALRPIAQQLGIEIAAQTRCEYGRYGVRVWRTD